jgi:hypothetical protein
MSVSPFSRKYRQNVSYVRSPRTSTPPSTNYSKHAQNSYMFLSSPLLSTPFHLFSSIKTIHLHLYLRFKSTHGPKVEQLPSYELSHLSPPPKEKRETQCLLAISSPIISQGLHYIISLSSPRSPYKLQDPSHRPIMGFENADWQTACRPGTTKAFLEHIMVG